MEHSAATVALIGVGRMGSVHAEAIRRHLPKVTLAAIAEPRAEAVAALGDTASGASVYSTAIEAFEHPNLDACIVVTPTDTHATVVSEALEHDLHVFCEKPLTLDGEQSRSL